MPPSEQLYRAYVGPAEDYDVIAATAFNLLTTLGLRGHHRLLDVGCGSLRVGRLLIPYLDMGNYTGIEPHNWLVRAGLDHELGRDILGVKLPRFCTSASPDALPEHIRYDYVLAQSIFSHTSLTLMRTWLSGIAQRLTDTGVVAATYLPGAADYGGEEDWVYPGCVAYRWETLKACAQGAGLRCLGLSWPHPRQAWVLLIKEKTAVPEGMVKHINCT